MTPRRVTDPHDWQALLTLIRTAFAGMEGRIDPPSSVHRLTAEDIAAQSRSGEVWVVEDDGRPVACMFLTPQADAIYIGKLAVDASHRGRGLARDLIGTAATRAGELGKPRLRLQTRIELTQNHDTFRALGFSRTGETSHPGYDRPTSITMERGVA